MDADVAALRAELNETLSLLAAGDAAAAERRAKAVSAFARAVQDVALLEEQARKAPKEEDVDALRAELELRIARFIDADRSIPIPGGTEPAPDPVHP